MEDNGLRKWFDNLNKGVKNEVIVFLDSKQKKNNISSKVHFKKFNFELNLEGVSNLVLNNEMQYLEYESPKWTKLYNKMFKRDIIIIKDKNSINEFINQLESLHNVIDIEDINAYLLKREDFYKLLELSETDLKKFLDERHKYLMSLYRNIPMWNDDYIDESIEFLNKHKILTANFANYLYKFAFLRFELSDTRIGIEVRKLLGTKSKTISNIRRIKDIYFPKGKVFKGYDLRYGIYFDIKKEIADKLISLKIKELDIDKICEVTSLPKTIFINKKNTKSLEMLRRLQEPLANN
ncbi:hypothetical protein ACOTVQ_00145 [Aliarcobacter butzleri]|uniref:hypothetical protein n=1 Tax=Aliarcobacter butzleri TaxID=28197 RepID=UPI00263F113F|nr:hypothetical protein [Aliarcobacter butzleri]MDN5046044.1 hypothetical protein [Aliarcobacter butzleri]